MGKRGGKRRGARRPHDPVLSAFAPYLSLDEISTEEIAERIAAGPVPIPLLMHCARSVSFDGMPVLEAAAALIRGSETTGAGLERSPGLPSWVTAAEKPIETVFGRIFDTLGEERSGQLEMARAVERAFAEGRPALLEAGTGTGKSLAYLVPAAMHALRTGERVVVSTHTKNLQDQLLRKETPLVAGILGGSLRAERLTGRETYLCTRSIIASLSRTMAANPDDAFRLALGAALARDGAVDRMAAPETAVSVAAPPRCPMNECAHAERCPLIRARRRAREAHILFVNHALLLTDYRQGGTVIGPYSRIVFDEAHHLERCIMENLSVKAARDDLARILDAAGPADRGDERWKFAVHELESSEPGGVWGPLRRKIADGARSLGDAYAAVFSSIEESANHGGFVRSMRVRYRDGGERFADSRDALSAFYSKCNELCELFKLFSNARLPEDLSQFQQDLSFMIDELGSLAEGLRFLAAGDDEETVFWLEWDARGALKEICGAPLGVDRPFADYLEEVCETAVFTSATLSQGGDFSFLRDRLGLRLLPAKPIELALPSPFPFDERCLILIVSGLGDPNDDLFADEVARIASGIARGARKRMMVLCTSYRLCGAAARLLEGSDLPGPVLVQGGGVSREALSDALRSSECGLLLGVASFWEGVDFPGEELEVLVIPKVPFAVPTEPIVQARSERLEALGEDPFERLALPEAILRMRQGVGRLIRRADDRGVVVILDSRLETRPYGEAILAALPSRNVHVVDAREAVRRAVAWFK